MPLRITARRTVDLVTSIDPPRLCRFHSLWQAHHCPAQHHQLQHLLRGRCRTQPVRYSPSVLLHQQSPAQLQHPLPSRLTFATRPAPHFDHRSEAIGRSTRSIGRTDIAFCQFGDSIMSHASLVGCPLPAGAQGGAIHVPCVWSDRPERGDDDLSIERNGGSHLHQSDQVTLSSQSILCCPSPCRQG